MKANEMPERIYLFDYNDAMVTPLEDDAVYVREDAFIEKAAEWMFSQASVYSVTHVSNDGSIYTYFYADKMVEDFKNYMKGE